MNTINVRNIHTDRVQEDSSLLQSNQSPSQMAQSLPVQREEVEEAVHSLKACKSPGVDNIPSKLLKNGDKATTTVLTAIYQRIWEMKKQLKQWSQSIVIPLPKKGNLKQGQNYPTISLISHPSKIMLQFTLNQLKVKAKELLTEERAEFRPEESALEQIFNSRVIIEKHLQHQHDLFHNFIDFKKAFDRVWHVGLWQVPRSFNIKNWFKPFRYCMRTPSVQPS